ncbi:hypothetical protein [Sphingobacterium sp.]|uniref:AbiU2 domain-containing protein n=1 Tax=Sphingobacterium sp. TaxID=341027 RepID=UPI00289AD583|nr:hypothetical protein [Sphingobacterium sp.]
MEIEKIKHNLKVIIGLNRVYVEMIENYWAFISINNNNMLDISKEIPTAMLMLMKNHYQIYIIEASKFLIRSNNHFDIRKPLNFLGNFPELREQCKSYKKRLSEFSELLEQIKYVRNSIFAHLDEEYYKFKNPICEVKTKELHELLHEIMVFINDSSLLIKEFDFREWPRPSIEAFYNEVFKKIVYQKDSKHLSHQKWLHSE